MKVIIREVNKISQLSADTAPKAASDEADDKEDDNL